MSRKDPVIINIAISKCSSNSIPVNDAACCNSPRGIGIFYSDRGMGMRIFLMFIPGFSAACIPLFKFVYFLSDFCRYGNNRSIILRFGCGFSAGILIKIVVITKIALDIVFLFPGGVLSCSLNYFFSQ